MGAAKHTPGPWSYGRLEIAQHKFVVKDANGVVLGIVPPLSTDQQQFADARLIAAAPALLEVLQEVVTRAGDLIDCIEGYKLPGSGAHRLKRLRQYAETADALIAQATGAVARPAAAKPDEDDHVCSECFRRGCNGECGGDDLMGASS